MISVDGSEEEKTQLNGDTPSAEPAHVRSSGKYLAGVLIVAAVVFATDQATKAWIVQQFQTPFSYNYIQVFGDYFRLLYTANSGAAFGLLQNQSVVFTIIAIVAAPLIIIAHRQLVRYGWPVQLTLGLLLGGTLGNLTDRLRLGFVVDFLDVGIGTLRWYTFNVADSAFVVGVTILFVYFIFFEKHTG